MATIFICNFKSILKFYWIKPCHLDFSSLLMYFPFSSSNCLRLWFEKRKCIDLAFIVVGCLSIFNLIILKYELLLLLIILDQSYLLLLKNLELQQKNVFK